MKLLFLTSLVLSLGTVAVEVLASSLLPRASGGITLCDGTNRSGNCQPLTADQLLQPVPAHYQTNLFSAYANQGDVCFMYSTSSCGSGTCEVCIDADGFKDMSQVPAVFSWKCEAADSSGCSNANCNRK